MGIGQWSKIPVKSGSIFNRIWNLPPGEYWMMYDQYKQVFCVKDRNGKIIQTEVVDSPLDIMTLVAHLHISEELSAELAKALQRGETPHKIKGLEDHHIIPVHLWKKSELIKQAVKITDIDLNGEENIIELPNEIHKSSHLFKSGYSELIIERLREEWNLLVNANRHNDPAEVKATVLGLIEAVRADLEDLVDEGISIGDWYNLALFNKFIK